MHKDKYEEYTRRKSQESASTEHLNADDVTLEEMGVVNLQDEQASQSGPYHKQKNFERLLVEWIAAAGMPFSVVEHEKFVQLVQYLDGKIRVPSRPTVMKRFKDNKDKVIKCAVVKPGQSNEQPRLLIFRW